jgi:acyl-CoA dehydrogenase
MMTLGTTPDYMLDDEFTIFSSTVERFVRQQASEDIVARWRAHGQVDREAWEAAGGAGLLCPSIPVDYGGSGGDFRHDAIIVHQLGLAGCEGWGIPLHNAIVAPYILHYGNEEQKKRWLPRLASGALIGAIAMTEPGAGSDLRSVKTRIAADGDAYRLSGAKTFITNGQLANLIVVVARSGTSQDAGHSLVVIETEGLDGFRRGRKLDKIGLDVGDTSELFFDDIRVTSEQILGKQGDGFAQLMAQLPQERLIIALECVAIMERALTETLAYVRQRKAFGKAIIDFQNSQFKLAEAKTKAVIAKTFTDHCIGLHLAGKLDGATASMAKYWCSDTACEIVDACLQLHGGYGYMNEYPIATMYRDVRVKPIYGGTNEIMKMLIARSL